QLDWRMLSDSEVKIQGEEVKLSLVELGGAQQAFNPDDIWIVHSWRQHPRRAWEPDSPTRSSLPVLRELVGLTMAVSSQIDSRLAGAGLLMVADRIVKALKEARGITDDSEDDPFTDALIEAMLTP